jgi:hypothetical protein
VFKIQNCGSTRFFRGSSSGSAGSYSGTQEMQSGRKPSRLMEDGQTGKKGRWLVNGSNVERLVFPSNVIKLVLHFVGGHGFDCVSRSAAADMRSNIHSGGQRRDLSRRTHRFTLASRSRSGVGQVPGIKLRMILTHFDGRRGQRV